MVSNTWIFQVCQICAFSPKKPTKRQKFYISGRYRYVLIFTPTWGNDPIWRAYYSKWVAWFYQLVYQWWKHQHKNKVADLSTLYIFGNVRPHRWYLPLDLNISDSPGFGGLENRAQLYNPENGGNLGYCTPISGVTWAPPSKWLKLTQPMANL